METERESIIVTYVDDDMDHDLIDSMRAYFSNIDDVSFMTFKFAAGDFSLDSFLSNPSISKASVIVIDSKLFNGGKQRFFGEDLVVVLQRILHYCRFILVTQENTAKKIGAIGKYTGKNSGTEEAREHYLKHLLPMIKEGIEERKKLNRLMAAGVFKTSELNQYISSVRDELSGDYSYETLSSKSIDDLMKMITQDILGADETKE